jgi:hypothetical protein
MFTNAAQDLHRWGGEPHVQRLYDAARFAVTHGPRFYVPEGGYMLAGRELDQSLKELVKLPFDTTTLLTTTRINEERGRPKVATWKISIAFTLGGDLSQRFGLFEHAASPDVPAFGLISVLLAPEGRWLVLPACAICALPTDRAGCCIDATPAAPELPKTQAVAKMFDEDFGEVANLCVMLNLQNVQAEKFAGHAKVGFRAWKSGLKALNSYHVLRVAGELWDRPAAEEGVGTGKRSHYRRGHPRRLDGGARSIWVRQHFVHGSRPGFVDKDYEVAT